MGRPSNKRLRLARVDAPPLVNACDQQRESLSNTWMRLEKHSSLNSLVVAGEKGLSDPVCATEEEPVTRSRVQQVWGALNEVDIGPPPISGLRLGVNAEVDNAGVAWLINTMKSPGSEIFPSPFCGDESGESPYCGLCDLDLRVQLSALKDTFDDIATPVFKRVRSECNAAEALGRGPFLNRSAMKLANIDAIARLSVPQLALAEENKVSDRLSPSQHREPRDKDIGGDVYQTETPKSKLTPLLPLLFADLCGGPGGFSEYLIRKRRKMGLSARGWGISLRDSGCSSGPGSNIEGECGEQISSSQTRNKGESVKPVHRGGDHGVVRIDEIRCNEASGSLTRPLESSKDPCAWRLDRLALWCHVSTKQKRKRASVEASGGAEGSLSERTPADVGKANRHDYFGGALDTAVSETTDFSVRTLEDHDKEDGGSTVEVTANRPCSPAIVKPSNVTEASAKGSEGLQLEITIDYGPKGTGDLLDDANRVNFVDSVLVSTGGRRLDVVVADGGFIAARDAKDQERLILPLLHAEVRCYRRFKIGECKGEVVNSRGGRREGAHIHGSSNAGGVTVPIDLPFSIIHRTAEIDQQYMVIPVHSLHMFPDWLILVTPVMIPSIGRINTCDLRENA